MRGSPRHASRTAALLGVLLLASAIDPALGGDVPRPRNVLMLIADDLNRMVSPLGDPNAITPNLERLAARSVCFENATCQFPFCSPSRASLFMGLYPWHHGNLAGGSSYPNPHTVFPDRVGLPEYFRQHGYWTASYGKTEHLFQPRNWDVQTTDFRTSAWRASYDPAKLVHTATIRARGITGSPTVNVWDLPPDQFVDGVSTTVALQDLATHLDSPQPEPFFAVVGFDEPHDPWDVPKEIFDQYDPAALVMNPGTRGNWPGWAWKINNGHLELVTDEQRRDIFHAYLAAVTLMDRQVGRILDFLDQRNLWDDTVVIFLSDNGFSLCEHEAMYAKRNVTRENLSVPLLVHAPGGGAENVASPRQVELQDLFPTLVDLCGLPPYPGYLDGRSIGPLLIDPQAPWPHVAKSVVASPNASFPTARIAQLGPLKIAQGGDFLRNMYFDHQADPEELAAELFSALAPPDAPQWQPLLDSLNSEFGFQVGQAYVFYARDSTLAPDRDNDGGPDSFELALRPLGFNPIVPDPARWERLLAGPTIHREAGGEVELVLPGFRVTPLPGFPADYRPLEVQESINLETWREGGARYEPAPDGSMRWIVPPDASPRRFFRLRLPGS